MSKLGFDFTFENIERLADIVNDKELSAIAIEDDKGQKAAPAAYAAYGLCTNAGRYGPPRNSSARS